MGIGVYYMSLTDASWLFTYFEECEGPEEGGGRQASFLRETRKLSRQFLDYL